MADARLAVIKEQITNRAKIIADFGNSLPTAREQRIAAYLAATLLDMATIIELLSAEN